MGSRRVKQNKEKCRRQEENNCSVNQVDLIDWTVLQTPTYKHTRTKPVMRKIIECRNQGLFGIRRSEEMNDWNQMAWVERSEQQQRQAMKWHFTNINNNWICVGPCGCQMEMETLVSDGVNVCGCLCYVTSIVTFLIFRTQSHKWMVVLHPILLTRLRLTSSTIFNARLIICVLFSQTSGIFSPLA